MKLKSSYLLAAVVFFSPTVTFAQGADVTAFRDLIASGISEAVEVPVSTGRADSFKDAFLNPETLNKVLLGHFNSDSGAHFLKDINFKFKAFDSQEEDGESSLGFGYSYQKVITDGTFGGNCGSECIRGLNLDFKATGNVAFDRDANPSDFLDTKLSLSLYQSTGGRVKSGFSSVNQLSAVLQRASVLKTTEELYADKAFVDAVQAVRNNLTDQYYFDFSGELSLESDQAFTSKQYVYGARLGFDMKSWRSLGAQSWSEVPSLARWNIFDYPFAIIRSITGYGSCTDTSNNIGSCFIPLGTSWPTVSLGLARVSPQDEDPRAEAGDKSDFDRFKFETAMRTPVAHWDGDPIYFSANYRYYQEINASNAVKSADLDSFDYFVITIGPTNGAFISYANGKLPLDASDDQVYTIGFKTHF